MESQDPVATKSQKLENHLQWPRTPTGTSLVGIAQVGLFLIAMGYALHEMKPVLLPVVLAIMASLIVHPIYVMLRAIHLPRLISASATVLGLLAALVFGLYQAFLPAAEWMRNVNQEDLMGKVQTVFRPVKEVQAEIKEMANRVEKATNTPADPPAATDGAPGEVAGDPAEKPDVFLEKLEPVKVTPVTEPEEVEPPAPPEEAPMMVEIHEDPVSMLMAETRDFGLGLVAFLLLVLFILAYGNRIVRQLNKNERVEMILGRMGKDISHYLFTITLINAALGLCIGLAMWALGMPNPALWGVMAMLLNFIPYLGALAGTFVIFIAAAVNFDTPGMLVAVPVVYFVLTAIEGNFVTPTVLGGRFSINPLIVFLWIFVWAGFWGVAGMLIAMPALVIFKIVCEKTERMGKVRRVLEA